MLLPTVTPYREYSAGMLLQNLRGITSKISSYFSGDEFQVLRQYQAWANESARVLTTIFDINDVEKLITTPRHWYLMSTEAMGRGPTIHAAVQVECADRLRVLTGLEEALKTIDAAWKEMADTTVIAPDTNVYLHHDEYFDQINWRGIARSDDVRLLIPVAVLRELDNNKRYGKNVNVGVKNEPLRTRARVTSRRIRELIPDYSRIRKLPCGVEVELVLDPQGHRRLDDPDSEIIDRLAAAQRLTGHKVALFTDDGNMEYGAKIAGLDAIRVR